MAVQQGYGKMAGANSLVFAYDTTDTTNSFKGRPTTNLAPYISTHGTSDFTLPSLPEGVFTVHSKGAILNGTTDWADIFNTSGYSIPNGERLVVSAWIYIPADKINNRFNINADINGNNTGLASWHDLEAGKWHKLSGSWLNSTGATANVTYTRVEPWTPAEWTGGTNTAYGINFMVESGPFSASYMGSQALPANATRSATEGLLDLTGNHTIDISNVSFNNGNIDFDGTSDFIETSLITTNSSNITSISWVYLEDWYSPNSTIGLSVDSGGSNGGYRVYNTQSSLGVWMRRSDGNGVSSISGNYRIPRKQWVQVAFVNDNGTGKIYVNDHVAISGTFTLPGLVNGPAWISRYSGGGYYLNGSVENVALYNRALSEAEIIANFNRNKKKHIGADCLLDHTTDGGGWIRFWWYTGVGWPGHETEALGHPFGTFDSSSHYGFQRLPEGLAKEQVELLAKDGIGNIYKWDFASPSATAQQVWDSFTQGIQGRWNNNGDAWDPEVIAGSFFNTPQDSWQYRDSEGVVSFLLDDDTCDCKSTLNAGHAMCGSGWNQTYAQPDGAYLRYGVDILNDDGCRGPVPENTLELFYRLK